MATWAPAAWAASIAGRGSATAPDAAGYCSSTPNSSPAGWAAMSSGVTGPVTSSMPSGSARVASTARVCGRQPASARNTLPRPAARRARVMASAAAVASSSMDAPETGSPARSAVMVWKLSSASRRPWEISGWYGVYAVYQAGLSSTLRRMTAGVAVS